VTYLKNEKVKLSDDRLRAIARHVLFESRRCNVDYRLILALMKVESNFKHDAVSRKGAIGLLQIKPSLAKTVAKDIGMEWKGDSQLHEPEKNIKIGVHPLSKLIDAFESLPYALHAYNNGSTKARAQAGKKMKPDGRFTRAVMKEYSRTLTVLPGP
jgi:soluble lytic murein transglycosylase